MAPTIDKVEYRALIRFLYLKGNSAEQIYAELMKVYGKNAPSYETVIKWHKHFESGETSLHSPDVEPSEMPLLCEEEEVKREDNNLDHKLKSMDEHQVVPDVVDKAPPQILEVSYGVSKGNLGNELTPTQVKDMPNVTWNAEEGAFYTLCMTDPDAPSRKDPKFREWHHWLVVNIPGSNITAGETLWLWSTKRHCSRAYERIPIEPCNKTGYGETNVLNDLGSYEMTDSQIEDSKPRNP